MIDPTMLMRNSMPGLVPGDAQQQPPGVNPAVNVHDDAASRYMLEQAGQLEAPVAPPPTAGALQQFFALLGANSGANLLRNPQAAVPAQEAVAAEMKKPEQARIEQRMNFLAARKLRLEAMIRSADNAAKQADAEGKHAQALNLRAKADDHATELENLKHDHRMAEIASRGTESRETKVTVPGKAAGSGASGGSSAAGYRAELNVRYRAAMAKVNGAIDKEARDKGWSKQDVIVAKGYQKQRLSSEFQALLKGEPRPAAPVPPGVAAGAAPPVAAGASPSGGGPKLSDTPGLSAKTKAILIRQGK